MGAPHNHCPNKNIIEGIDSTRYCELKLDCCFVRPNLNSGLHLRQHVISSCAVGLFLWLHVFSRRGQLPHSWLQWRLDVCCQPLAAGNGDWLLVAGGRLNPSLGWAGPGQATPPCNKQAHSCHVSDLADATLALASELPSWFPSMVKNFICVAKKRGGRMKLADCE